MFKKNIINNINSKNDISYKAPLSYRHYRIIGWITLALMVASIFLASIGNINEILETGNTFNYSLISDIFGYIGQLAIPFFLLANFALILTSQENIKKLVIFHASLALLIYLTFILLYERYYVGIITHIFSSYTIEEAKLIADSFIRHYFTKYLSINVFMDLLMCSLLYLFFIYKPKKIKKEKLIYYRLLVLIPILYELASWLIKGLSLGASLFTLPIEIIPLLTNKPIVTFFAFFAILFFVKYQKNVYLKLGGEENNYKEFIKSNAHTFQIGTLIGIIFAIAGTIDLIITIVLFFTLSKGNNISLNSISSFKKILAIVQPWGFGKGISLLFVSPLSLLFNYQKKYSDKSKNIDIIIPLAGVALITLIIIEGVYQIIVL